MISEWKESWLAHRREHMLEKEAVALAREDMNRRLDAMNELRKQIDRERGAFVSRVEFEGKQDQLLQRVDQFSTALQQRIEQQSTRIQSLETQQAGLLGRLAVVASLAGFCVSIVVTIVLKSINV